jgi:hypothetical protein
MKKYIIALILLLLLQGSQYTYSNFTNYYNNLTQLEKNMIKFYASSYTNSFVVVNMFI